ncbi:eukaryotic translation initiation factor 4E, putative [Bodo saltans]|uniref:Eukaryotic translation initiation factor 4E, putative n=1 Tax=Bodo saltans TaxID=75058 RepID=A0A0S4IMC6_BODSA|nr:eukaryotic translation initiation factor 4E, putative [Bodo saltans]|eukprot:CUE72257.1 eukaryotic translation initiation factor 4E, putative [Bodo saltans]
MADLNLGAKEFIPSWLKQPATRPAPTAAQPPVHPLPRRDPRSPQPRRIHPPRIFHGKRQHSSRPPHNLPQGLSNFHPADLNLGAKEFIPSWLKQPATRPAPTAAQPPVAPTTTKRPEVAPAPPNSPPSHIPWKAPTQQSTSTQPTSRSQQLPPRSNAPAAAATASSSHMNPNATVFQPKFVQSPAAQPMPAPPVATQRPPLVPQAQQWPATKKSPQLKSAVVPMHMLPPSSQPLSSKTTAAAPKITKSDDEVLQISKHSSLKVGAAVFVPGQRSANSSKSLLGKPSPLTLTPASPDTEMMLFDTWSLYCLCNSVTKSDTYDPTQVFRIDSVPTFWKVMNNLPEPTELSPPTTMYLFRDDINPKWEDKKNISGGMWRIRVLQDRVDAVWLVLLCKTIGESWQKEFRNTVNGIVLKVREKGFYVEIWVTEKKEQFPSDLVSAFEEQMPVFTIDYYTHQEIQEVMSKKDVPKKGGKKNAKRK